MTKTIGSHRRAIPTCLMDTKEGEDKHYCDDDPHDDEDPSPSESLDYYSGNKRDEIFPSDEKHRIDSESEGTFMEEEYRN